jgi:dimethylargininase
VSQGLRAADTGAPSYDGVQHEHGAYVRALEEAGVAVETLPPLEQFPDAIFVEDTALVFTHAAILLRPGAPSRAGEAGEMAPVMARAFDLVLPMVCGTADGGDVLATSRGVFIGLSKRTDAEGAAELMRLLAEIGQSGVTVTTPPGVLHLKSDCALLDEETILCTRRLATSAPFSGFRLLLTPEGEESAANALRVGDAVFLSEGATRTAELLGAEGYAVERLPTREIAKLDAGLSCMSLRWRA